jgi:hypothetical protein
MRFRKSIKIAPGIKINFSKSGISSTIGGKGLSVNMGKNGTYLNTGIPGTGISNRTKISGNKTKNKSGNLDTEKTEWFDSDKLLKTINKTTEEIKAIRESTRAIQENAKDFEYKEFKKKIKLANGKVNFASNLSYRELYEIMSEDDDIIIATQYCGKSSLGAITVTKYLFYAACKKDDQLIVVPIDEIKSVSITGGFFKTDMLIETDNGDHIIKSVVKLKETISALNKIIQK